MLLSNARIASSKVRTSSAAVAPARPARVGHIVRAADKKLDERGVIAKDNSGRQNIFPTSSKAYYSSPTSSAVASSGLGGQQGLGVIAAAFAIVALATAGVVLKQGDETLAQVNNAYQGDSLTVISQRIAKSL